MSWIDRFACGYLCLPLLGFFGAQAVRLLRESWDGVIRARSDGEIRPFGATNLAYELFAMLDDKIPQTNNAPVTINTPVNGDGLTINSNPGDNAFSVNGGDVAMGGNAFGPSDLSFGRNPTATNPGDTVAVGGKSITLGDIGGGAVPPSTLNFNGDAFLNGVPLGQGGGGGGAGGGTSTFLGKVVGGSGVVYTVALYGGGPDLAPTAVVTATVPQLDDTISPGTWIAAVHEFVRADRDGEPILTYAFQPPIWLE